MKITGHSGIALRGQTFSKVATGGGAFTNDVGHWVDKLVAMGGLLLTLAAQLERLESQARARGGRVIETKSHPARWSC